MYTISININKYTYAMKTINNVNELHTGDFVLIQKPNGPDLDSYLAKVTNANTGRAQIITNSATFYSYNNIVNVFDYREGESILLYNKGKNWYPSDPQFIASISLVETQIVKEIIDKTKKKVIDSITTKKNELHILNNAEKSL